MKQSNKTWFEIGEVFGTDGENVRAWAKKQDWFHKIREEEKITNKNSFKEEVDFDGIKGTKTVTTLVELFDEADKTPERVMEMLGYRLGVWDMQRMNLTKYGKEDSPMYAARLEMKPDKIGIDYETLGDRLAGRLTPKQPKPPHKAYRERYLVIPIFDPHFDGKKNYDRTLGKIFEQLEQEYKRVLIISGGDILHTDNYQSTTASGTQLETTDMNQAWEDAFDFFDLVIDKSLDHAETVEVLYVPGNHDTTVGQTLFKALTRLYQKEDRLTIDDRQEMFKATLLGHNFIGATHGVKRNKKDYPMLFATQFSQLWGTDGVQTRETFVGHLHHEWTVDMNGLVIRQMPTRNETDQWHKDNGFVGSHKRFQLVEYSEYEAEMIRYV